MTPPDLDPAALERAAEALCILSYPDGTVLWNVLVEMADADCAAAMAGG